MSGPWGEGKAKISPADLGWPSWEMKETLGYGKAQTVDCW
jgi:hypothetical protein